MVVDLLASVATAAEGARCSQTLARTLPSLLFKSTVLLPRSRTRKDRRWAFLPKTMDASAVPTANAILAPANETHIKISSHSWQ